MLAWHSLSIPWTTLVRHSRWTLVLDALVECSRTALLYKSLAWRSSWNTLARHTWTTSLYYLVPQAFTKYLPMIFFLTKLPPSTCQYYFSLKHLHHATQMLHASTSWTIQSHVQFCQRYLSLGLLKCRLGCLCFFFLQDTHGPSGAFGPRSNIVKRSR